MFNINVTNMLNAISQMNHVLNETVTFVKESKTPCPSCTLDPIRQESTNPNCDTCGGSGYVISYTNTSIPASIETAEEYNYSFTEAGKLSQGQIYMTVDIKELNTLNSGNAYNLTQTDQVTPFMEQYSYVGWQGGTYSFKEFEQGFLEGNLYEIAFTMELVK